MLDNLNEQERLWAEKHLEIFKEARSSEEMNDCFSNMLDELASDDEIKINDETSVDFSDDDIRINVLETLYENIKGDIYNPTDQITLKYFLNQIKEKVDNGIFSNKIYTDFLEERIRLYEEIEQEQRGKDEPDETKEDQNIEEEQKENEEPKEKENEEEQKETEENKEKQSDDTTDGNSSENEEENKKEETAIEKYVRETNELEGKLNEYVVLRDRIADLEKEIEEKTNDPETNKEFIEVLNQTLNDLRERFNALDKELFKEKQETINIDLETFKNRIMSNANEIEARELFDLRREYAAKGQEIIYLKQTLEKIKMDIYDNKPITVSPAEISNSIRKLEQEQIELKKEIDEKQFELDNKPEEKEALIDEVNKSNLPEETKEQLVEKINQYEVLLNEKKELEGEVLGLEESIKATKAKYNQAYNIIDLDIQVKKLEKELKEKQELLNNKDKEIEECENFINNLTNNKVRDTSKIKEEIEKRKENIKIYQEALIDIKDIEKEVKENGKEPTSEEITAKVDAVKAKIAPLPPELRSELEKELENALTLQPENIEKDNGTRNKWIAGLVGFGLGFSAIMFTPLGATAAAVIAGTATLARVGVNALHKHYKKEELAKENVVTEIEKPTGKLAEFKEKFRQKMLDEEFVRNLSWFLTGTALGAGTAAIVENITNAINKPTDNTINKPEYKDNSVIENTSGTPTPEPSASSPYSDISVGNNAGSLDLSQGYDSASWATNNVNVETLNQSIMQDGNSVINRIVEVVDGNIVNEASSVEELISMGANPENIAISIAKNGGGSRAWVSLAESAAKTVGRTL